MIRNRRIACFTMILIGLALPAAANNPPRPDGVLYLILVFPMIAILGHLAGAVPEKHSLGGKIGRFLFFTFVILMSAAGTGSGFFAAFIIVLYGIVRSWRIIARGVGGKRFAYAGVALIGSLAAGFGYLWAASTMNSYMGNLGHQKRTMSDIRTISIGLQMWIVDHAEPSGATTLTTEATPDSTDEEPPIDFSTNMAPPRISFVKLEEMLVPEYIKMIPMEDGWRRPFDIRFDPETCRVMIRSSGRDREFESEPYVEGPFPQREFHHDIVNVDGRFVRWPENLQTD